LVGEAIVSPGGMEATLLKLLSLSSFFLLSSASLRQKRGLAAFLARKRGLLGFGTNKSKNKTIPPRKKYSSEELFLEGGQSNYSPRCGIVAPQACCKACQD